MKSLFVISFSLLSYALNIYLMKRAASEENLEFKTSHYLILACLYVLIGAELNYLAATWDWPTLLLLSSLVMMSAIAGTVDFFSYYIYELQLLSFSVLNLAVIGINFGLAGIVQSFFGMVAGFLFYGAIYYLAKLYYKREAFGFGDVLFLAAIGIGLGWQSTLIVGVMAFYLALMLIVINKLFRRNFGLKSEMPFGPAIALAVYLFVIHQDWVIGLYQAFQKLVGNA